MTYSGLKQGIERRENEILPGYLGLISLSTPCNTARSKPVHNPAKDQARFEAGTSALSNLDFHVERLEKL